MNESKNKKNVKVKKKAGIPEKEVKSRVKMQEGSIKLKTGLIICLVTTLIITAIFYFLFDSFIAIITAIGLLIIFGFTGLMRASKKNKKKRKALRVILIIFLVFAIIGVLAVGGFAVYIVIEANPKYKPELLREKQSTILYDNEGHEFAKLGQIRENVSYEELPEIYIDSLIATEDSRFFQHNGVDLARFSKAAFLQLLGKDDAGGGSTITMQVVKNNLTDTVSTGIEGIIRKFSDIYLAVFKLEKDYTKEQIIEFYANNHLLGGAWGVEEASKYYFNKSAKDLNIAESSLLAGMYRAPETYNPFKNPENATKRRQTVLNLMVRHGYITREEADLANSVPVSSLLTVSSSTQNKYQGYIDTLCEEIKDKYGLNPRTTSMLVYTNMDRKKQDAVNDVASGKSYDWLNEWVQAGSVILDSETGKVEALLSYRTGNETIDAWNYATDTKRQIGSTAKPLFDYGPGMEYNNWSTYTLFDDSPYTYTNGPAINNYDGAYKGIITLRQALSDSRNIPALKAFQQLDKKKVIEFVTNIGITPEIQNGTLHEAHAIGAFDSTSPMQMAGAYQIFSNGGYYTEPYLVSKIILRSTGEEINASVETKQVISDSTAYMITDVLKDIVSNRMRNGRYKITDNFAAKTGTTNYDSSLWKRYPNLASDAVKDCWVMGYTNKTVISLWYGYKDLDPEHLDRVLHWNPATVQREALFNALANAAFDHDGTDFEMPSSVVEVGVEAGSNPPMLPSSNTPSNRIVYELFKKGTEPTETSNAYSKLDAPTNFTVNYSNNKVKLSWDKVLDPGYISNGVLGYYIYFDDKEIAFTTKTSYTIDDLDSYLGKYTIRTGYKNTSNSMSNPVSKVLASEKSYTLSFKGNSSTYINAGEGIEKSLYDGSLVVLKEDGKEIKGFKVSVTITDDAGNTVSAPSSFEANTYTVSYTVTYNGATYTDPNINNKIIIKPSESQQQTPSTEDTDD